MHVVIAVVVTPEGGPLAYEVLPGNTADKPTRKRFLPQIETQYGKAERTWVMDRGLPTEAVLEDMRAADPAVSYVVGTPKGRLTTLERELLPWPWATVRKANSSGEPPLDHPSFSFRLNRKNLRAARRREGRYLLRTNLCGRAPEDLWRCSIQLTEVEAAFKPLKDDLQLRPIYHQLEHRIDAHIVVAVMT